MSIYLRGQTIEVGVGDYDEETQEIEDGSSYFMYVDVDSIDEDDIVAIFGKTENVLYVQLVEEEQGIEWGKGSPLSEYLNFIYKEDHKDD